MVAKGATVAAGDIDADAAKATADMAGEHAGVARVRPWSIDVSDRDAMLAFADEVCTEFGHVDVLINNAGVLGQIAPLSHLTYDEMRWIVDIDLWGVIHGSQAFLPQLQKRPEAALVNVSSIAGLMGSLGNSAYFAAKFGVRGFTECLRSECRSTNVQVTVVHPGVVKTNLASSTPSYSAEEKRIAVDRYNANPGVSAAHAANKIVHGIERGKPRILIGKDVWAIDKLVRALPSRYDALLYRPMRAAANSQRPDGLSLF
jgi:NAD(P)-dependent dehydrogenase (short-subunit alcohol dehydrogenase family)